jgi:dTDP-4-dehydrorhamnose reductase
MKKVLVCGQRGFMGSNIFKYLMKRPDLMVVGESTDLLNAEAVNYMFSISKPDIVIQAAAVTSGSKDIVERPYIHVTDNAIMNSIILRACYEHKVKHFIFLSCGVMYQPGDTPREE